MMNTKDKCCILLVCISFFSCVSGKLNGKIFSGSNDLRKMTVTFVNDSICQINQTFYCDNIPGDLKSINITANYKKIGLIRAGYYQTILVKEKSYRDYTGIKLNNVDSSIMETHTPIPGYFDKCVPDSTLRQMSGKIPEGLIYRFLNDTILLRKRVMFAGGLKLYQ